MQTESKKSIDKFVSFQTETNIDGQLDSIRVSLYGWDVLCYFWSPRCHPGRDSVWTDALFVDHSRICRSEPMGSPD